MTCEGLQERLTALSLGELEPAEAAAAREHIAHCGDCASAVLLDRQLTALLRASAVPAPEAVRSSVLAALRAEAAGAGAGRAARPARRRHWLALGTAALAAAAALAIAVLLVPAPDPGSTLAAAWRSYHREPVAAGTTPGAAAAERLYAVIGPAARTPDLSDIGLRAIGWDNRNLAGHLAVAAEYRDGAGHRFMVMRWRGELPHMARAPDDGQEPEVYRWGRHASAWWRDDGVVWCLIGTVDDQASLHRVAERLARES